MSLKNFLGSRFLAGLLGLVLVVYFFFPVGILEIGTRNLLNERLPEPVVLQEINVQSLNTIEANVALNLGRSVLYWPFRATFSSPWNPSQVEIVSPPGAGPSPMQGTFRRSDRSVSMKLTNYSLSTLLPDQNGNVSGEFDGKLEEKITGNFTFDLSVPKVADLSIYPPFLRGTRIETFQGEGSLSGRTLEVTDMKFRSNKFALNGSMTAKIHFPIEKTRLDVDLDLQQPVDERMKRSLTLGDLGI